MANGTAQTAQQLIAGVSNFSPFNSDTTVKRWLIWQLNQLAAGLPAKSSPTEAQIAADAGNLGAEWSPTQLDAMAAQLLLQLTGGAPGFGAIRSGTTNTPNGTISGNSGDIYVSTTNGSIWVKAAGFTVTTGWTQQQEVGTSLTPYLANGWTQFGSGNPNATVTKTIDGYIRFDGLLSSGTTTSSTVIFTLPTQFRPASNYFLNVLNGGNVGGILLQITAANGNVQINGWQGGASYLNLGGASFPSF